MGIIVGAIIITVGWWGIGLIANALTHTGEGYTNSRKNRNKKEKELKKLKQIHWK